MVLVDHLPKKQRKITNIEETIVSRYIYQNELDKACFKHDIDFRDFKNSIRRRASDKILGDKTFGNKNVSNKALAEELCKRKVRSPFIDNIWNADLINMHFRRKFNKGIRFLLCVIDTFSKNASAIPLKDKILLLLQCSSKNIK